MEGYFERVVETLTGAGYRWYETANFCRTGARAAGRDLRAHHNSATGTAHDYLGVGVGAVSTLGSGGGGTAVGRAVHRVRSLRRKRRRARSSARRADARGWSGSCSGCVSTSRSSSTTLDREAMKGLATAGPREACRGTSGRAGRRSDSPDHRADASLGGAVTAELLS